MALDVQAAPSTQTINFSARLKSSSGAVVPDGYYNIGFKIYDQNTGGESIWSEIYHDANGTAAGQDRRVRVANGYFSVKLGSVESLTGIDWTSDLWLTMNVGGTSQIASPTNIPWDGEMSPRIQLAAVPYAMNANTVGGKSANQLIQLGQGMQADASNNSSLSFNKTGAGNLINLQADGTDMFRLDKSGNITLGSASDHSIAIESTDSGAGRDLTLSAGSTSDDLRGGNLVLQGGSSSGQAIGGNIQIDSGSGGSGGGNIVLGAEHAVAVDIGNETSTTTIRGSLGAKSMTLGDNSDAIAGLLNLTSGNGHIGTISGSSLTASRSYALPDEDGTFCLQGSDACGFIKTSPTVAQVGNIWLTGGARFGSDLRIQTTTNSATAFVIQNADGDNLLSANTSSNRIVLGSGATTATLLVLGSKADEGDPTGVNGAMYYSEDRGKMRCYENDAWENCLSNTKGAPTTKDSSYTADYGDFVIADSTNGAFTVTLPEPRAGAVISVKKINAGNSINVVPSGTGVRIDNLTSVSLSSQWVSQDFYSDGTRWYRV